MWKLLYNKFSCGDHLNINRDRDCPTFIHKSGILFANQCWFWNPHNPTDHNQQPKSQIGKHNIQDPKEVIFSSIFLWPLKFNTISEKKWMKIFLVKISRSRVSDEQSTQLLTQELHKTKVLNPDFSHLDWVWAKFKVALSLALYNWC